MFSSRLVRPAASVLVPYFGQLFLLESGGNLDQCGPETAMHVGNFAFNQLAHENVRILRNRPCCTTDIFSFRMAPPIAPDVATDNRLRPIWKRSTIILQ